ncbi:Flp family type IVb pilin [Leekyejoonella antrihumi]|uniref:Flp family type IVb pilin n=1 Tax=Leekyejoonella antrihumi TaxID=1660198 RepID=A0A563DUT8_9MICO|nr:Flp family type IVb pilin [Leekyejoonella antrihumi]
MGTSRQRALRRAHAERGVTSIEYGVLVLVVALVLIAGASLLGRQLLALYQTVPPKL